MKSLLYLGMGNAVNGRLNIALTELPALLTHFCVVQRYLLFAAYRYRQRRQLLNSLYDAVTLCRTGLFNVILKLTNKN